jgi:hypothetical protein
MFFPLSGRENQKKSEAFCFLEASNICFLNNLLNNLLNY